MILKDDPQDIPFFYLFNLKLLNYLMEFNYIITLIGL